MSDEEEVFTLDFEWSIDLLEGVLDRLRELDETEVAVTAASVRSRREASAKRAETTRELLQQCHQLDKARVFIMDNYHEIVSRAKRATERESA